MSNSHVLWCDHRQSGETHDADYPYCLRQLHGVNVNLTGTDGQKVQPKVWVYATAAAHPDALTSRQRAENDKQYDGIELLMEQCDGSEWSEQKLRLNSDAARSLAATLVRAADIQQGLTR